MASPVFLDACRLALFAEVLGPEIAKAKDVMALDIAGLSPEAKRSVGMAKVEAPARLAALRSLLGLDDG